MLLWVEVCWPWGHRGRSWSSPRNTGGGRERRRIRHLRTRLTNAASLVLELGDSSGRRCTKSTVCAKAWAGEGASEERHRDLALTFHQGCLGLLLGCGVGKVREMSLRGCGLLGFVNQDPEGRVESPKDFKLGRTGFTAHAGNFAVATVWRNGCWPLVELATGRAGQILA